MKTKKMICGILALSLVTSGCSAFRSGTQELVVITNPPEADIFINGIHAGTGVGQAEVKRNEKVFVTARTQRVRVEHSVGKSLNKTGILDLIGSFLFILPVIGLLTPGAYSLDDREVHLQLEEPVKEEPSEAAAPPEEAPDTEAGQSES